MATALAVPALAPRPSPRPIAVWPASRHIMDVKDPRPTLETLHHQPARPVNRWRRERPCDGCRKRKSKCVLQDSRPCVLCEFHKQDCTFVENAQPRKRKADDSNNNTTTTTTTTSDASPTTTASPNTNITSKITATANSPSTTSSHAKKTSTNTMQPASVSAGPSHAAVDGASRPPPAKRHAPRRPYVPDETLSLQSHRHCKYLGQTTALDACLVGLGYFNDRNETESQLGMIRQVTSSEFFSTHADSDVPIPDDEARHLAEIEQVVGPHGDALIDIYFRNVHPSYPIIQKQAFLERHQHGDRSFNPPLLAAMYILALAWWDTNPAVSSQAKPDVARLESIAKVSLSIAMQRPKISAVQAGLLLLQRPKSSTWTMTVQLVALAQDIGLHLDCTNWSIPEWERRLRKRLAWALYMQDKWSAVMYGRPSHINAADWSVPALSEIDFDESSSAEATISISSPATPPHEDHDDDDDSGDPYHRGRTTFLQMIALTGIMAEVCDAFYSETAKAEFARAGRYATQLVLNRAKPVQIRLKDWFARLPHECKMDSNNPPPTDGTGDIPLPDSPSARPTPLPQGYLHLAYFATEISIHRRIVQSLADGGADAYLLHICRSAAKTRLISALDFVNRLKPGHLEAFWFFPSASNFALIGTFGALLQVSSPGREEAYFYACRLKEFRWTLSVSAKKALWVAGALEMLDANSDLLRRLPDKPLVTPPPLNEVGLQSGMFHGSEAMEVEETTWEEQYRAN